MKYCAIILVYQYMWNRYKIIRYLFNLYVWCVILLIFMCSFFLVSCFSNVLRYFMTSLKWTSSFKIQTVSHLITKFPKMWNFGMSLFIFLGRSKGKLISVKSLKHSAGTRIVIFRVHFILLLLSILNLLAHW